MQNPKSLLMQLMTPKKLPILIGIPAVWFAFFALITVYGTDMMTKIFNVFGVSWSHAHEGPEHVIAHADFFSTWFVDMTFVPLSLVVTIIFVLGLKNFLTDIHENAVIEGKTSKTSLEYSGLLKALTKVIPTVLKHDKFNECESNKDRATPHMMVLYAFIALFIVTAIAGTMLYVAGIPGPYSQLNPVKWLANIAGVALVIGSGMMIKNRLATDQKTYYKDWFILVVVFALGVTGMLTELTRIAHMEYITYFIYYLHLISIFLLFAFLPFSKMAHLVYRLAAMTYTEYSGRK